MAKKKAGKKTVAQGKYLKYINDHGWEYVDRKGVTGVVVIVAVTKDRELVLIEQERKPVGARVIELPAGLAGDIPGEEEEAFALAAERELMEETGYEAKSMTELTEGPTSAGMSTEVVTFFGANNVKRTGKGGGDANENIDVHVISLRTVKRWLKKKQEEGCLIDPKVYAGLYFVRDAHKWD